MVINRMPRYPRLPLEEKLAWLRERQQAKQEEERRQQEERKLAQTAALAAEVAEYRQPPAARSLERLPSRKMLRVDEVAKLLGMSVTTVRRWFRDRAVVVHAGRTKTTMLISEAILDEWIRENTAKPRSRR